MQIASWLAHAIADAEARGLPELKPLLETLARSTQALRDADGEFHHPAAEHAPRTTPEDDGPPITPDEGPQNMRNTRDSRNDAPHDGTDTE